MKLVRLMVVVLMGVSYAASLSAAEPRASKANRLAGETSPYLLLHAHNPVDWYPWGEEALAKAKAEQKLIFLSIGYSSCYWCHVMERESFMDAEVAAFMNKNFICIKVDREERPDIDEIYMTSLQVLGRPGGWPLTMFLTPDAQPFFGGTYFPPRDKLVELPAGAKVEGAERPKLTGLMTLLEAVVEKWKTAPDEVRAGGKQLADFVRRSLARRSLEAAALPDAKLLDEVASQLTDQYDVEHGGFGFSAATERRPKFPEPTNLVFLIDRFDRARKRGDEDKPALAMLVGTLEKMAAGGIRDHLGGGFHRYSTDRFWRVPHFEKMLYDNGQLASVYTEAHRLTGRDDFKQVVVELLAFVDREMTDPAGGFYSALDAETDADEGKFYVWNPDEARALLTAEEFGALTDVYGLSQPANFEHRWVLLLAKPVESKDVAVLATAKEKLLTARSKRKRPLTDTKVLTSWNGLMIRGYADAGRLLDSKYTATAARAADFALAKLRTKDGRLLRTYSQGEAKLNGYLDDYAFLVDGLISLHQATNDRRWLTAADELTAKQVELFWDDEAGGFFYTSHDHETLIARSKDPADSATPSANAVAASNLVYLSKALNKPDYLTRAEKTITSFSSFLSQAPVAMPRMAVALGALLDAKAATKP